MGDSATASAEGDAPDGESSTTSHGGRHVLNIDPRGDVVLDLTFTTSASTLRKSRKAQLLASRKAGVTAVLPPELKPVVKEAYRVSLAALKRHSKYFGNLFSNSSFREAKLIEKALESLKERGLKPSEAEVGDLPWLPISDDDEATKAAGREHIFEDMLRIIHQKQTKITRMTMSYVTTLAITADRFDCAAAISRCLVQELKFKWPVTNGRPMLDDTGRMTDVEQILRQKILSAWLLNQPLRLHHATRELVMRGSASWSAFHDPETDVTAAWWSLPDGLERRSSLSDLARGSTNSWSDELQYRRECILNTVASVQQHFLQLYSSRDRQCKLGYESSASCDSFQLGQLLRFLLSRKLSFLVDFSPMSLDTVPDTSMLDIEELLVTLRQMPAYQVDKHHTNCGPRIRFEPVLEYIRAMLSTNIISIPLADWKKRRMDVSWVVEKDPSRSEDEGSRVFAFTRAMGNDGRLKMEGNMYADKMAKRLFTADAWDWTPEL